MEKSKNYISDILGDKRKNKHINRLYFSDKVSPFNIEKFIKMVLIELGEYQVQENELYSVSDRFQKSNWEKDKAIRNSILHSFTFNKIKYNRYNYFSPMEEEEYTKRKFSLLFLNYPIITCLNINGLNEIRNFMLYAQNKGLFKNFSENKLAEILTYKFQTLNNNEGNSVARNRQYIEERRRRSEKERSLYYSEFKILKKSVISPCL